MKEGQYFQNDPETKHQIHIARNLVGTCHKSRAVHFCFLTSFALILQASMRSVSQGYVMDRLWGNEVIMFACSVPRSHLSVCDPLRCSSPGSSVPGTFQARINTRVDLPAPPPGDLPDLRIEPSLVCLLHLQAGSLPLSRLGSQCKDEAGCREKESVSAVAVFALGWFDLQCAFCRHRCG